MKDSRATAAAMRAAARVEQDICPLSAFHGSGGQADILSTGGGKKRALPPTSFDIRLSIFSKPLILAVLAAVHLVRCCFTNGFTMVVYHAGDKDGREVGTKNACFFHPAVDFRLASQGVDDVVCC